MNKLLILDWDGTLHDSIVPCGYVGTCKVFEAAGVPAPSFDEYVQHFATSLDQFYRGRGVPFSDKEIWEIYNAHTRHDLCSCFPDVKQTLESLRQMGIKVGIVSAQRGSIIDEILQRESLRHLLDFVMSDVRSKSQKIEELTQFHGTLDRTYHVGDLVSDVHDGLTAGAIAIGITRGNPTRQVLVDAGAHHCIDHLPELLEIVRY